MTIHVRKKYSDRKSSIATESLLPLEILAIIAEHLIGQHAFRTAANLATASEEVDCVTSPAIYETVFYSSRSYHQWKEQSPASSKHTKFVMLETEDHTYSLSNHELPQLVMTAYASATPQETGACYVHLYRMVSSATVFTVLATPIKHSAFQDHMCLETSDREKLLSPDINPSLFYSILWLLRCRCGSWWTKSTNRPVQAIRKVSLDDGAFLHENAPVRLRNITTSLVPYSTEVKRSGTQGDPIAIVHTTLELFKLFTIQARPGSIHDAEYHTRSNEQNWAAVGKQRCLYSRPYAEWHMLLSLDSSAKDLFVAKFKEEAKRNTLILQNRINIKIADTVEPGFVSALLFRLAAIYEENVTSKDRVLPFALNALGVVLKCEALTVSDDSPGSLFTNRNRLQSEYIAVTFVKDKISVDCVMR